MSTPKPCLSFAGLIGLPAKAKNTTTKTAKPPGNKPANIKACPTFIEMIRMGKNQIAAPGLKTSNEESVTEEEFVSSFFAAVDKAHGRSPQQLPSGFVGDVIRAGMKARGEI